MNECMVSFSSGNSILRIESIFLGSGEGVNSINVQRSVLLVSWIGVLIYSGPIHFSW